MRHDEKLNITYSFTMNIESRIKKREKKHFLISTFTQKELEFVIDSRSITKIVKINKAGCQLGIRVKITNVTSI